MDTLLRRHFTYFSDTSPIHTLHMSSLRIALRVFSWLLYLQWSRYSCCTCITI